MKSRPAAASVASMPFRFRRPALPMALLAAAACGQAVAAADDPVPYYLGVSQTETADSNVLRLEDNGSRTPRDLISTTALNVGLDQPIGRGRLVADLEVNTNNFKNQKQLNYTGGEGKLRLDWETLYRISGDISLHQQNTLYRSNPSASVVVNERDVLRNSGADLRARIGLVTRWSLEGGASYGESRHSSRIQSFQNLTQTTGNIGIRFRPSDLWSVRLGARDTQAEYPNLGQQNGTNQSDEVKRNDIDLSGDWNPTGNSRLDARLSSTRERHSLTGTRDINTWTGLLGYNWLLTGKTRLRMQLARDSNVGNSDADDRLTPPPDAAIRSTSDTQTRNRLSLQANWDATSKISADFGYTHVRSKLDNTLSNAVNGATLKITQHDRSNIVGLGLTYRPTRNVLLGCKYSHEERSADNNPNLLIQLTFPYKVDTGSCQVQFRI